jgi:hypothetical protein
VTDVHELCQHAHFRAIQRTDTDTSTTQSLLRLRYQASFIFRQKALQCVVTDSVTTSMLSLPQPFCNLQCHELDTNSREHAFDTIAWFDHPWNGKKYGCISEAGRDIFKQNERSRGHCDFYKKRSRVGILHSSNETWICNRSQETHLNRKEKQQMGHAVAANCVKQKRKRSKQKQKQDAAAVDASAGAGVRDALGSTLPPADASTSAPPCTSAAVSAGTSFIQRVGKNSTGESLACAACKYQMQLIVFKADAAKPFIVLSHFEHTNDKGTVCHGPGSSGAPLRQKADAVMREFIRSQHQAGVPATRIHQGIAIAKQTCNCTFCPCQIN